MRSSKGVGLELISSPSSCLLPTFLSIFQYAGVNFIDTYQRKGEHSIFLLLLSLSTVFFAIINVLNLLCPTHPSFPSSTGLYPLKLPFILGNEPAGQIASLPSSYSGNLKVGDSVASYSTGGAFAEYTIAPTSKTLKLPSGVDTKQGATAILQGLTALTLLREAHPVKKDDWILVHAAAGGVGLLTCQIAKHLGCNVIGTTSSQEKADLAKQNGADHIINYTKENLVDRVLELTNGNGVVASFDGIGKDTWEDNFKLVARKGTIVTFGNASGAVEPFAPLKLAPKNHKGEWKDTSPKVFLESSSSDSLG